MSLRYNQVREIGAILSMSVTNILCSNGFLKTKEEQVVHPEIGMFLSIQFFSTSLLYFPVGFHTNAQPLIYVFKPFTVLLGHHSLYIIYILQPTFFQFIKAYIPTISPFFFFAQFSPLGTSIQTARTGVHSYIPRITCFQYIYHPRPHFCLLFLLGTHLVSYEFSSMLCFVPPPAFGFSLAQFLLKFRLALPGVSDSCRWPPGIETHDSEVHFQLSEFP